LLEVLAKFIDKRELVELVTVIVMLLNFGVAE
jgi:hypothetical protein